MHIGSGLRLGSIRKKRNLFNNLFLTPSLNHLVNFNDSCTKSCMLVFHCAPRNKKLKNVAPGGLRSQNNKFCVTFLGLVTVRLGFGAVLEA